MNAGMNAKVKANVTSSARGLWTTLSIAWGSIVDKSAQTPVREKKLTVVRTSPTGCRTPLSTTEVLSLQRFAGLPPRKKA